MEVICLATTRIFDFPGKWEVTYVWSATVSFCSIIKLPFRLCLRKPMAWASTWVGCAMVELGIHFECRKKALLGFFELKMLKFGPLCVYNHCNGWSISTSCFAGKNEGWLVTVIFGNAEVYTTVVVFSWFRRMERTLYPEKESCIGQRIS
jgi:hypothetical protein